MTPDLQYEIEKILETYHGYFSEEVNEDAHNRVIAEDLIRVFKQYLLTVIK